MNYYFNLVVQVPAEYLEWFYANPAEFLKETGQLHYGRFTRTESPLEESFNGIEVEVFYD